MYGAILGDIIGSPYEFDQGSKSKNFPLFSIRSHFTDDTIMTIAVADAFLHLTDVLLRFDCKRHSERQETSSLPLNIKGKGK